MEKFAEHLRTNSGIRLVFMARKRRFRVPDPVEHDVHQPADDSVPLPKPPDPVIPGSPPTYCSLTLV